MRMRNLFHIGILIVLTLNLSAQQKAPKLEVTDREHDFGILKDGEIVTHEYVIKNIGNDLLRIEQVRSSCGCTAVLPEKDRIEPGDFTTIKVTFNTYRRIGKQKKYVYVFTNDPNESDIRLSFTADVKREITEEISTAPVIKLEKNYHNFGDVIEGEKPSVDFFVENTGQSDLVINSIKSTCDCLKAEISGKNIKPGKKENLKIVFDTSNRTGTMTRNISVESNDPKYPNKSVTIFVNILRR